LSLEENFRTNNIIENNSSFLIIDHTKNYNETERIYTYYVWNGLIKKVYNNERRFAIEDNNLRFLKKNMDLTG
jgi:hypothetical protein